MHHHYQGVNFTLPCIGKGDKRHSYNTVRVIAYYASLRLQKITVGNLEGKAAMKNAFSLRIEGKLLQN